MYYIRHDHLAIVSEEMWETAQEKLAKKSERNRQGLPSDEIAVTKKAQVPDAPEKRTPKEKIPQKEKSGLIPDKPPLTLANYPYKDRIFCKYCGSRLRRIIARNHSVWWICNGLSRKGKAFCKRCSAIPDEKLSPLRNISFFSIYRKGAYRWKRNLRLFLQARRMETLNLPTAPNAEWHILQGVYRTGRAAGLFLPIRSHITRIILMKKRNTSLPESFSDEGISGTGTRKRAGFRSMIAACEAGKVDLVITKSISRFARNTRIACIMQDI